MTRGEASDSTSVSAIQDMNAGLMRDEAERLIADVLTAKAPCQPFTAPGAVAHLGQRLARLQADHNALDQSAINERHNAERHDHIQSLMSKLNLQSESLQEAISHGRAETLADVLTQVIIGYRAAAVLSDGASAEETAVLCGRLIRIAASIGGYASQAAPLDPDRFGARSLMPAHLDFLAPDFMREKIGEALGRLAGEGL